MSAFVATRGEGERERGTIDWPILYGLRLSRGGEGGLEVSCGPEEATTEEDVHDGVHASRQRVINLALASVSESGGKNERCQGWSLAERCRREAWTYPVSAKTGVWGGRRSPDASYSRMSLTAVRPSMTAVAHQRKTGMLGQASEGMDEVEGRTHLEIHENDLVRRGNRSLGLDHLQGLGSVIRDVR